MNKFDKHNFVCELVRNVEREITDKLDKTPKNWDGIELRWLVRDHFNKVVLGGYDDKREKRYKDYENTCLVDNLV